MYVHRQEHSFHHTGYKNYRLSQIQYKHHRTISLNIRIAKSANPNRDTTSITRQILYQIHQSTIQTPFDLSYPIQDTDTSNSHRYDTHAIQLIEFILCAFCIRLHFVAGSHSHCFLWQWPFRHGECCIELQSEINRTF